MIDASGEESMGASGEDEMTENGCPMKKSTQSRKLIDEEIVAHALTFILAGYETTANTLAYTSYLLALNPHIQEKLQSEIDSYFDEKTVSELIGSDYTVITQCMC